MEQNNFLFNFEAVNRLLNEGRLSAENIDVSPYVVDNKTVLCETTNGINMHYYWQPTYGKNDYDSEIMND